MSKVTEIVEKKTERTLEEKCVFEWQINNTENMIMTIRSPVFTALENVDSKFYFEVWLNRKSMKFTFTNILVVLKKLFTSSVQQDLRFHLHVSVTDVSNGEYKSNVLETLANFGAKTLINRCTKGWLPNTLILRCRMIFSGHLFSPQSFHKKIYSLDKLEKKTKDFMSLYESNAFSDVSIQVGEEILPCHKFVLAAHSPVFKRMLEQDFLETKSGIITISDFEPEILKTFLKFLYTAEMEEQSFSDIKLFYALANKYDVQFLKEECLKMLKDSSLNEEEINEICQMAQDYNDDILKTTAKSFLANHFQNIFIKTIF